MNAKIQQYQLDQQIREGFEYSQAFWDLVGAHRRLLKLERDFAVALIQQERNEFIRKVKDCDRPGFRHMLPTVRVRMANLPHGRTHKEVRITEGSHYYTRELDKFAARIKEACRG